MSDEVSFWFASSGLLLRNFRWTVVLRRQQFDDGLWISNEYSVKSICLDLGLDFRFYSVNLNFFCFDFYFYFSRAVFFSLSVCIEIFILKNSYDKLFTKNKNHHIHSRTSSTSHKYDPAELSLILQFHWACTFNLLSVVWFALFFIHSRSVTTR